MEKRLKLTPTAGFIPDVTCDSPPGSLSPKERSYLIELAKKVAEIAHLPEQRQKAAIWKRHNILMDNRPTLLVFPEDSWFQMLDIRDLTVSDPYWKQWEWYLKHLIYRHERLHDDFVIKPEIPVPSVIHIGNWGLDIKHHKVSSDGAYSWDPPIKEERDIELLKYPSIRIDREATAGTLDAVGELFDDILPVKPQCGTRIDANVVGAAAAFRGMEQIMLDMYDRPDWLHRFLNFFTDGYLRQIDYLESEGLFTLNNENQYTDAGGLGYTTELPAAGFDGEHVRTEDLWIHAAAQEYSEVSPWHHEEFGLDYQMKITQRYGLVAYGCCEPYTSKFDMVKKIPNLRRVSVSPWCDVDIAAQALENKYIFSYKPNPAYLATRLDEDFIRKDIRRMLDATRECVAEIILKDTYTIENQPDRIERWIAIVREEIDRIYS